MLIVGLADRMWYDAMQCTMVEKQSTSRDEAASDLLGDSALCTGS